MNEAQRQGAQCTAITFWALLGSFFWNQFVTCANGHYEPGVFDVRGGDPVATELAEVVAQIAAGQAPSHPALSRVKAGGRGRSESAFAPPDDLAARIADLHFPPSSLHHVFSPDRLDRDVLVRHAPAVASRFVKGAFGVRSAYSRPFASWYVSVNWV